MTTKNRSFRVSPALVISCLALFMALAGSAFAAGVIGKNSVGSPQIVDGSVRTVDLHDGSVNSAKVKDDSLTADDLAPNAAGSDEIAENAVSSSKVAPDSLTSSDLGPNSVTSSEIADNSVGSADIAPDSVRATQLGTITQRNITATIQAGKTGSVSADCEPGEQIISGGGQPSVFGVEMTTTRPQGNGWLYQAKNTTATDQTITAFALCLVQ
jgi:hypothetical protein